MNEKICAYFNNVVIMTITINIIMIINNNNNDNNNDDNLHVTTRAPLLASTNGSRLAYLSLQTSI